MPRHGKKFCMICNPDGNGSTGIEGTEAVGWYYLPRTERTQYQTGDIAVCQSHAEVVEPYYRINYFTGKTTERLTDNKDPKVFAGPYEHDWEKMNLVTEEIEGKLVDRKRCSKCGAMFYSTIANQEPREGCAVPDGLRNEWVGEKGLSGVKVNTICGLRSRESLRGVAPPVSLRLL